MFFQIIIIMISNKSFNKNDSYRILNIWTKSKSEVNLKESERNKNNRSFWIFIAENVFIYNNHKKKSELFFSEHKLLKNILNKIFYGIMKMGCFWGLKSNIK